MLRTRLNAACLLLTCALVPAALLAGCGDKAPTPASRDRLPGQKSPPRIGNPLTEADAFIASRNLKPGGGAWRETLPAPIQFGFPCTVDARPNGHARRSHRAPTQTLFTHP